MKSAFQWKFFVYHGRLGPGGRWIGDGASNNASTSLGSRNRGYEELIVLVLAYPLPPP